MSWIDLNADLGEGMAFDADLLDVVSSASIACGGHAGSETIMRATLAAAKQKGVATGAHPGFADPEHFGRRRLELPVETLTTQVCGQIQRIDAIAGEVGQPISFVKLHGALYNMASEDFDLAHALFRSIVDLYGKVPILALDGSAQVEAAITLGLPVIREAFADRRYSAQGTLISRSEPGAVIDEATLATDQAVSIAKDRTIVAVDGTRIGSEARSICLHGDTRDALMLARAIRAGLTAEGITIKAAV